MSGKNAYAKTLIEKKRQRQDILTQMCADAAAIAANEVFHRNGKIVQEFIVKMMETLDEIAHITVSDAKDDPNFEYAKATLDRRLQSILKDAFQPWDERYGK